MEVNRNIKDHSLKSIKWVSLGIVLPKLIRPLTTIILANLLMPSEFGIISLCMSFISFFSLIQGLGFTDFIIKEIDINQNVLFTAFWGHFLTSLLLYVILLFATPFVAFVYKTNELSLYLPIVGLSMLINSIGVIPNAILRKSLKFKSLFFIQIFPMFINIAIVIPLAYLGFGVWALIFGALLQTTFVNFLLVIFSKWLPKFEFNKIVFFRMVKFGKFVILEQVMEFIYGNLDLFLIAYFFDLSTVGIYSLGKTWILVIFNMINSPINSIVYPSLNFYKNDFSEFRKIFINVERRMIFLNIPVITGIAILASSTVGLFLPPKWEQLSIVLLFLSIGEGISRNLSMQRDIYKIIDRPEVYPKSLIVNLLVAIIFYPIASKYGLISFCFIKMVNDILYTFIQALIAKKMHLIDFKDFWNISKISFISSIIMGSVILFLMKIFLMINISFGYIQFSVIIFSGLISYFYIYFRFDKLVMKQYFSEAKSAFRIN
jgi:O-antigen/teichoic acid export membrane protein